MGQVCYDKQEVMIVRDIPVFTTQLGVASLILSQIPYTKTAYIRLQDCHNAEEFLAECCGFCKMAGAEHIFATGNTVCERHPLSTAVISMRASKSAIGKTDACLFPVTEKTLDRWRTIYNDKVVGIPNGAWMRVSDSEKMLCDGSGYFVHRDGVLLGIGKIMGNQLQWVASVHPGGGEDVVKALCGAIMEDTVTLEVADVNEKAMALYRRLGFLPVQVLSQWYRVK